MILIIDLGFFTKLESIRKQVCRDAMLQTVGDLANTPETGTDIMDRWGPIDTPYVNGDLIYSFNLMAIIEIYIRNNPLTRRVVTTFY